MKLKSKDKPHDCKIFNRGSRADKMDTRQNDELRTGDGGLELNGKRALITGAGRRVGKAIALHLASMGADIIVHYHTSSRDADETAAEILAMGRKVDTIYGDFAKPADIQAIMTELDRHGLDVDILVNSAAVYYPTPLADITAEMWDHIFNINLRAPFLLCQALGLRMKERGNGTIVNMADCNVRRIYKDFLPYFISKSGIMMLTEALALELAPEVRVNAIAPGTVLPPDDATVDFHEQAIRRSPLKMPGSPEDIAAMVGHLATHGKFITGTTITIDGGATIR